MNARLRYALRLIRVRGWWDNLLHLVAAAALLWWRSGFTGVDEAGFGAYVGAVTGLLMGGYTLNDAADFHQDTALEGTVKNSPRRRDSFLVAVAALATGSALLFAATEELPALAIGAGTLILGIFYSVPPPRFKERGLWGVVLGATVQRPALFLVFAAALHAWGWLTAVLFGWLWCGSALSLLGHQILDHDNDVAAGVRTFAARHGRRPAFWLCGCCAVGLGTMILAPIAFVPLHRALPVTGILAALSTVYLGRGLKGLRYARAV